MIFHKNRHFLVSLLSTEMNFESNCNKEIPLHENVFQFLENSIMETDKMHLLEQLAQRADTELVNLLAGKSEAFCLVFPYRASGNF